MAQANLKLPLELKTWLQQQAEFNRRSLNSEVVYRLEQSRQKSEGQNRANGLTLGVTPQPIKVSGDSHDQ